MDVSDQIANACYEKVINAIWADDLFFLQTALHTISQKGTNVLEMYHINGDHITAVFDWSFAGEELTSVILFCFHY